MPSWSCLIKSGFAVLCLLIFSLIIAAIFTSWRIIHSVPVDLTTYDQPQKDEVIAIMGIVNNCKSKNQYGTFIEQECDLKNLDASFLCDTPILAVLSASIGQKCDLVKLRADFVFVLNFLFALTSEPKLARDLPPLCFIATLFISIPAIIFGIQCKEMEIYGIVNVSEEYKNVAKEAGVTFHDYYLSFPFPLKITFGIGFYLAIAAGSLSIFTFLISFCVAISVELAKPKRKTSAKVSPS
uniref:Uncharacterized protein n=1 Tax=Panagrolaimus davidi TaxID=227884 RepID=A0A914PGJ6_9BILA